MADQLRPALEYLEAATRVTADELLAQHGEQQALAAPGESGRWWLTTLAGSP